MIHKLAMLSDEARVDLLQLGVIHPLVELLDKVKSTLIIDELKLSIVVSGRNRGPGVRRILLGHICMRRST